MVLTTVFLIAGYSVMFASNFVGLIHMALIISVILGAALFGDLLVLPALLLIFKPDLIRTDQT
jgi:predicted RND superfamily exporter protein